MAFEDIVFAALTQFPALFALFRGQGMNRPQRRFVHTAEGEVRQMSTNLRIGFSCVLALGLGGCGSNTTDTPDTAPYYVPDAYVAPTTDAAVTPVSDAAVATDTTPITADPYIWVVIQDTEQNACSTNGPGADIDAVALVANTGAAVGTVLGYGINATFTPNPLGNACSNAQCSGQNCKYAYNGTTFTEADLVARTEGAQDGQVNAVGDDVGYLSLNAGTLQLQIGDVTTGVGPMPIMTGDQIQVYEVDQTYPADGYAPKTCSCLPEHYTVTLQNASGSKRLPLTPTLLDPVNAACTALTPTSTDGCGSTLFVVP